MEQMSFNLMKRDSFYGKTGKEHNIYQNFLPHLAVNTLCIM